MQVHEDAGPGPLAVSVLGPYPAGPIVITPSEGYMGVKYHPVAPGDYTIQTTWGGKHINGSPFVAHVTGVAVRDTKKVRAIGIEQAVKVNQLTSYKIVSGQFIYSIGSVLVNQSDCRRSVILSTRVVAGPKNRPRRGVMIF